MKPADVLLICILATTFGSTYHVVGFHTLQSSFKATASLPSLTPNAVKQKQSPIGYNDYLNPADTGSVVYQPNQPLTDGSQERPVYDPGDELLRTLNAEFAANGQVLGTSPEEPDYADTVYNELEVASKVDMLRKLEENLREEQNIVDKSALIMKYLEDPTIETIPVVYVEEGSLEESNELVYPTPQGLSKRSRYYRRFPWKRHNRNRGSYMPSTNSNYEPELRYACTPSKEDLFKLLVHLHGSRNVGSRQINNGKNVEICNRKRPAKSVFTNLRFLG